MRLSKTLSKEESKQGDLIPEGIYPFEIIDAEDTVSKTSGAEMIKLKLKVFLDDGRERIVFDYLLEKIPYKLAHFFESIGKWDKYESGEFCADDCYGASGEVKIYTQKSKDPAYGDKSAVADYMLNEEQSVAKNERKVATAKATAPKDDFSDDLPF